MPIGRQDFQGLSDQYLDITAYNLDPAFQNLFLRDPKEIDQRRLNAYRYFMDFYKGRQWEESGEYNPAYGGPNWVNEEFSRRAWNHAANIVDKLVAFLCKNGFKVKVSEELAETDREEATPALPEERTDRPLPQLPSGDSGPPDPDAEEEDQEEPSDTPFDQEQQKPPAPEDEGMAENEIEKLVNTVWEANGKEQFLYQMALMGCITGDCFVKISYDSDFYAQDVGELKLEVLDSRTVIPVFDGHDRHKMIGCRIQYPTYEVMEDGSKEKIMYQEVHTESTIVFFRNQEVERVVPNPLGEMLVVHVPNEPLPFERFGRSDLENLIVPQKEFNEKVSDLSEILAYHAAPVTIVKGARIQALEKGAKKVWGGIPKDGDVYNLNLDADLSSTMEYLDRLRTFIGEAGDVPQEVTSANQEVSNTSGAALHIQYQPTLDRIQKKYICYGNGLRTINRLILRFYEAVGAIDLPEDIAPALKYKTSIEWGDALPRDRSIELSDISTEMGLGIESKKGAMERLGVENVEEKMDEIRREALEQADMDFMTAGLSGFGNPMGGPEDMGAAAGNEDGPQNDVSGAVASAKTNPITQGNQTSVQAVKKSAQEKTGANRNR